MFDTKKYNLTIVDESNLHELFNIDEVSPPNHDIDYNGLLEEFFVGGRILYKKKNQMPLMYWFYTNEIANLSIKYYNGVLTIQEQVDILIKFYKEWCIENGNTFSIYVPEKSIDVCNYMKQFGGTAKLVGNSVVFTLFHNHQKDWFEKEMIV